MRIVAAAVAIALLGLAGSAFAAGEGASLRSMDPDYSKETLRKGARSFADNCLGCHSLSRFRYRNLVDDLGMTKQEVEQDLMKGTVSINDHMESSMTEEQAREWFGTAAPDLSLVGRVRGPDWIYSMLLGFHRDPDSGTGWNNRVFPQAAMPNVLYNLTPEAPGYYDAVPPPGHGEGSGAKSGELPGVPEELDGEVRELVSFLAYASDPSVVARRELGPWVLGFLALLGLLTYLVKREYWRDVH